MTCPIHGQFWISWSSGEFPNGGKGVSNMLGSQASTSDLFSAAVSSFLPEVVPTLLRIGIRRMSSGKQRPRGRLGRLARPGSRRICDRSPQSAPAACVPSLLAKRGVRRIDLKACLDEIAEMGDQDDRADRRLIGSGHSPKWGKWGWTPSVVVMALRRRGSGAKYLRRSARKGATI